MIRLTLFQDDRVWATCLVTPEQWATFRAEARIVVVWRLARAVHRHSGSWVGEWRATTEVLDP